MNPKRICIHALSTRSGPIFLANELFYAVFKHQGPISEIQQTYDRIYGSWFPLTGDTPTMDLDIIVIDHRFKRQSKDNKCIYLAVNLMRNSEKFAKIVESLRFE